MLLSDQQTLRAGQYTSPRQALVDLLVNVTLLPELCYRRVSRTKSSQRVSQRTARVFLTSRLLVEVSVTPGLKELKKGYAMPLRRETGQQLIPTDLSTGSSAATASSACSAGSIAADVFVLDSRNTVTALLAFSKTENASQRA